VIRLLGRLVETGVNEAFIAGDHDVGVAMSSAWACRSVDFCLERSVLCVGPMRNLATSVLLIFLCSGCPSSPGGVDVKVLDAAAEGVPDTGPPAEAAAPDVPPDVTHDLGVVVDGLCHDGLEALGGLCPASFQGTPPACHLELAIRVVDCGAGQVQVSWLYGSHAVYCNYRAGQLVGGLSESDTPIYCGRTAVSVAAGESLDCSAGATSRTFCVEAGAGD
jgi:hypothetical protein